MKKIYALLLIWLACAGWLNSTAQNNTNVPLGMNLGGLASWNAPVFVNVFNQSRTWISQKTGQPWGQGGTLDVDADGWIRSLQTDQYAETPLLDGQPCHESGDFVLLYDGEGTITISNVTIKSSQPGRIVFTYTADKNSGFWLQVRQVTPANYIKNIRVLMPGTESTYQTQPFYQPLIDHWGKYKVIRFMDWLSTNNNPVATWAQRTTPQKQTQASNGISWEYVAGYSKTIKADPWICIPHLADDDYVRQCARLLRDNLHAEAKIYVEYSNEVWNTMFGQCTYAQNQGVALKLDPQYPAQNRPWEAKGPFYARRSMEIFKIFEEEFGGTSRLMRVFAWQHGQTGQMNNILNYTYQLIDGQGNPALVGKKGTDMADAIATAPYFGGYLGGQLSWVNTHTVDDILDACQSHVQDVMNTVNQQVKQATDNGKIFLAYEAGPHLAGTGGNENNQDMTDKFIAANRHPRMKEVYTDYLNRWKASGAQTMCIFSSVGDPSKWGSWSILESYCSDVTTSPKYAAVRQFSENNTPAWWLTPPVTPPPAGEKLIDFKATSVASNLSFLRNYQTVDGKEMVPFDVTDAGKLFDGGLYNQATIYGGFIHIDPVNPGRKPTLEKTNGFKISMDAGNGGYSEGSGLFIWRKDQFLKQPASVSVGKFAINITGLIGKMRFVVKNNGKYYVSEFLASSTGTYELIGCNNSSESGKRWKEITPTATGFAVPDILTGYEALTLDAVTEVGIWASSKRDSWGHTLGFDSFQVYELNADEFSVNIDKAVGQTDPTITSPVRFKVSFNQTATGFDASDVQISGSAGATTATVLPAGPAKEYTVEVSGMTLSGTVKINIAAGVATNSSAKPNRAATYFNNNIQYNVADPVAVAVSKAATQADPAFATPVLFKAVFDRPVTGFEASDVVIEGSSGATTAVVTQLAPNDGTTYQISVTGMTADGTVSVRIPAGKAVDSKGAGNLASTGNPSVQIYISNPPRVTLSPDATQASPVYMEAVRFTALFNQPINGFENTDITIAGTTGATTATITELAPFDKTTYQVSISGMTGDGSVSISLPAGMVTGQSGSSNFASDPSLEVFYFNSLFTGGTIIRFDGSEITTGASVRSFVNTPNGAGTIKEMAFDATVANPIFNSTYQQARFVGGIKKTYASASNATSVFQLRTINESSDKSRVHLYIDNSTNASSVYSLFIWPKELYLNNMDKMTMGFTNDAAKSKLQVNVLRAGGDNGKRSLRFVVKNGEVYYMSEYEYTFTNYSDAGALIELTGFNNTTAAGKRWTVIDPSQLSMPASPVYEAVKFNNVTAVGFAFASSRNQYGYTFSFDKYAADAELIVEPGDHTQLHNLISECETQIAQLVSDGKIGNGNQQYPATAKTAFEQAIGIAKTIDGNVNATQSQLNQANTNLLAAQTTFNNSKVVVDLSTLNAKISEAQNTHSAATEGNGNGQYPAGSKTTLQNAISAASTIATKEFVLASEVQTALNDLQTALTTFNNSKVVVDLSTLNAKISEAQSAHSAATEGNGNGQYPAGSKTTLQNAISAASNIATKEFVLASEVQTALNDLQTALQTFASSKVVVSYTALNAAISEAENTYNSTTEGTGAGQYPASARADYQLAINTAKLVAANTSTTQTAVNEALSALLSATEAYEAQIQTSLNNAMGTTVRVYPNPVTSKLFVSSVTVPVMLRVLDVNGRMLLSEANSAQIDVSALAKGVYLLQIDLGTTQTITRFVKQ